MATILMWNVGAKPLDGLVENIAREYDVDIILLVEYAFGMSQLPAKLRGDGYVKIFSDERFGIFTRANHKLSPIRYRATKRVSFWKWVSPSGEDGLIVLVHGLDRRNYDDSTRRMFFRRIREAIRRRESQGHQRTLITGDFNAHPFESAVMDADGLHAIGVQNVKAQVNREVRGAGSFDFFYNPMWRLYGHVGHSDAGAATHYWLGRWCHEPAWYMLDQVIIRPGELARFPETAIRIVTQVGDVSLLDDAGLPDSQTASDHLPLVFDWNL